MSRNARLEARWRRKYAQTHNAHRVTALGDLPARTRLRLAAHRRVDRVGAWLCGHGCPRAALWLWRACRMV